MDLVDTLHKKICLLEDGQHVHGLKAVLLHIQTAVRHLARGQNTDDDTAFTDAIYRSNQAFEGSIKEAYRVLAGKDPSKKRPYDIEDYLEQNRVFRPRVLAQMTTYRTEWRNPSTHDHRLNFDESEAFLAIVSVAAFSCLLIDQIAARMAFTKSQAEAEARKEDLAAALARTADSDLIHRVTDLLVQFCAIHMPTAGDGKLGEAQAIGAIQGFFSSVAPELDLQSEAVVDSSKPFRADLLVTLASERLVVEVKRSFSTRRFVQALLSIGEHYVGDIKSGILLFLPSAPGKMVSKESTVSDVDGGRLVVLAPEGANLSIG